MTQDRVTFRNGRIFDGSSLLDGYAVSFEGGKRGAFGPDAEVKDFGEVIDLEGDILSTGYVDLQVNGGGGVMLNDDPSLDTLTRMARAHRSLGVIKFLPTLITDAPEVTRAAIAATKEAVRAGVTEVAGLHLEGPHLSIPRKGAHDARFIRKMDDEDMDVLLDAARALPCLKMTLAPESVTKEQVATLTQAGVLVSLGHTDTDYATCRAYMEAGARCVTHLFNAMSQLGNREPGLVGAALSNGAVSAGLIADAIHVHPASMRTAWQAKAEPGQIYLVTDAMAVAGTDDASFQLNGRTIRRENNSLRLENGTLAGADLDLTTAIRNLVEKVDVPLERALIAAIHTPAKLIGVELRGPASPDCTLADLIRIKADLSAATPLG